MRRAALGVALLVAACSGERALAPLQSVDAPTAQADGDPENPPPCNPIAIHVRADAKPGGDGSFTAPLRDIRAALKLVAPMQCKVSLHLAPGTYEPPKGGQTPAAPLLIDRQLDIVGHGQTVLLEGLVVEKAPAITLSHVTIASPDGPALRAAGSDVTLTGVTITQSIGYGIQLSGGSLTALGLTIANTAPVAADPASGTAVHLTGGVRAALTFAELRDNVRGVFASGGTVAANGLRVLRSSHHPALAEHIAASGCAGLVNNLGAVEFTGGAVATGATWAIQASDMGGLYVHDGATATARAVVIQDSRIVAGECGGYGVIATRNGTADITNFFIVTSGTCAVAIGSAPGSAIDLHRGILRGAPVGACNQNAAFDTMRLRDRVAYVDVGVPLSTTGTSLPDVFP